ncbi:MAG TPA: hypothetical protein VFW55_08420 [Propionicimonas sp.]|nr:hypothetical protein [Propionicimonas sp.]
MALTEWDEIFGILGAVFSGMLVILTSVVHLEQWLAAGLEPPRLTAVPPVLEPEGLEPEGLVLDVLVVDALELDDQGVA